MKTVIITGANGNLGEAVTSRFLSLGYHVIATVRSESGKQKLPAHQQLDVHTIDLSHEQAVYDFAAQVIASHKTIDAALMLAGGFAMGDLAATGGQELQQQFSMNFNAAYFLSRALMPHMMENGSGRMVFIGARPALQAKDGKNMVAYALSKSLLFRLAEFINAEAKDGNVTATVIVPSTIDTPPNRASMPAADFEKWVKPDQLAEVMAFIVSEQGQPLRETVLKVYQNA